MQRGAAGKCQGAGSGLVWATASGTWSTRLREHDPGAPVGLDLPAGPLASLLPPWCSPSMMTVGQTSVTAHLEPAACEAPQVRYLAVPGDATTHLRRSPRPYHSTQLCRQAAKEGKFCLGGCSACCQQRGRMPLHTRCPQRGTVWSCFPSGRLSGTGLLGRCIGKEAAVRCLALCPCNVSGCCAPPCSCLLQGWLWCPRQMRDVPSMCSCWRAAMALWLQQLCHAAGDLGVPSLRSRVRLLRCTRQVS